MYQACLNNIGEIMKISKISLAIVILICAIGIAAATDLPDIKVAEGYKDLGDGSYTNEAEHIEMEIMTEKDLEDLNEVFKNDSAVKFTTTPGKLNSTFNFTDGVNEMVGVNEVVKIDNKSYVIEFWKDSHDNVTLDKLFDSLEEFNKLNNLEPINPSNLND